MQLIHADANRYYHTLAKTIKYRLLSDLEDEVSVGRLRVEHGEGELVGDLLAVELLRVLEQVDEGVHLLAAVPRRRHQRVRLHLPQVAALVVARRRPVGNFARSLHTE